MKEFKLLALGDVVGQNAVSAIGQRLWGFRRSHGIDMVVCNAENCAVGNGVDPQSADRLLEYGCDVLTGGNHSFQKRDIRRYLDDCRYIVRPANYPAGTPGNGYTIAEVGGQRVLVINVMGTIYLEALACPFATVERILEREAGSYDIAALDIHAEATSEKIALGWYFDGKITAIWGTHTHVATADMRVLPGGSGYVTDLGMSGPQDGVLGIRRDIIIDKLRTKLPVRFEPATGEPEINGCIYTIDIASKRCIGVERVKL